MKHGQKGISGLDSKPKKKPNNKALVAESVMTLFGRSSKGKHLFLTPAIIKSNLHISDLGKVEHVISLLVSEKRVMALQGRDRDIVYLPRPVNKSYAYEAAELINILSPHYFNEAGKALQEVLGDKGAVISAEFYKELADTLGVPTSLFKAILNVFVKAGFIREAKKTLKLTAKLKEIKPGATLGHDSLSRVFISEKFSIDKLEKATAEPIKTFKEAIQKYDDHRAISRAKRIVLTSRASPRVQSISQIQFGHQDLDWKMVKRLVDLLAKTPVSERPDVLIVSGIVAGGFKHVQKNRQKSLAIHSEMEQLSLAKMFFEQVKKLGISVIYNMSQEDIYICENRTYDALRIVHKLAPQSKTVPLNFWHRDELKRNDSYNFHFQFQARVVFEYQLRCGRRLYSAEEVGAKHGIFIEEYLMLLESYYSVLQGGTVSPIYAEILEVNNIPFPERPLDNFFVADDFYLELNFQGLQGEEVLTILNKHSFKLTPVTMAADPTKSLRVIMNQLGAHGDVVPDVAIVDGDQQGFGVIINASKKHTRGTVVLSTPGMQSIDITRGALSSSTIDPSRRKLTTRREIFKAGSFSFSHVSPGMWVFDFMTKGLLDKMSSSSQRIAIPICSDWQIGSITARANLQVKFMSYIVEQLLPNMPVHLFFIGDHIQGKNYSSMPIENRHLGLVSVDDQAEFVRKFLLNIFLNVPPSTFKNLIGVEIEPGNHEWNSGYSWLGTSHCLYLVHLFEMLGTMKNTSLGVRLHRAPQTITGDHVQAFVGMAEVAGYNFLMQHLILEKGAKGNSGPAVYQWKTLVEGMGSLMESIDVMLNGHWHHPMFYLIGDKLGYTNSSLAGLSGYEWFRGYRPFISATVIEVGGNLPPRLTILTEETLMNYKIKDTNYYSTKQLNMKGFFDDPNHDPVMHGFMSAIHPQSALQKVLFNHIQNLTGGVTSVIG